MTSNGLNGEARKVVAALVTAGILGAWTFAATRASSNAIKDVKEEIAEVEREAKERHQRLQSSVNEIKDTQHQEAVEAARFRAQVREALRIRENPNQRH